jgi:site-specific DNA-methyltransferase (adenine-specific)
MDTNSHELGQPTLRIICGDALEKLRGLPSGSVQCCLTSPPYDGLRTYGGFSWDFEGIAKELYRVMCEGGVVCWIVGDSVIAGSETLTSAKQKIFFRERCGFRIHDTMFYEKSNPANPSDGQLRYNQVIEYIFVLAKGRPRCFNPIYDKPNISANRFRYGRKMRRDSNGNPSGYFSDRRPASEFGFRGNCWRGNTAAQENPCQKIAHPAVAPRWLVHDLVLSWSNVGDIVLDPFAGSGTTGEVALELARRAILVEVNPKYIPLIEQRRAITPGLALRP